MERRTLVERRPVVSFFAVMFAWSWGYWALVGALLDPASVTYLVTMPGLWGPIVASLVVTRVSGASVRGFLGRTLRSPVATRWYAVALVGPVVLGLLGALTRVQLADTGMELAVVSPLVALVVASFAGGSEELGLRGFVHPRLRRRFGGLPAGVLIGLPWAVWHLPLHGLGVGFDGSFPLFVASVVPLSVLLGWLYDSAGGNVLPVVLAHAGIDAPAVVAAAGTVPADVVFASRLVVLATYLALVAALVAKNGVRLTSSPSLPRPPNRAADSPADDGGEGTGR